MRTWDEKEQEFNEKVVIALNNVAQTFEKMGSSLPAYDFIKPVSSNYYVVNINDVIDPNSLDHFLRKELEYVQEDFEYRIYNCETEEMVFGNYISYSSSTEIEHNLFVESPIPHPTAFFNRKAVIEAGGYRNLGLPEDYELWLRLWSLGFKFFRVPKTLLAWRERKDRFSRTSSMLQQVRSVPTLPTTTTGIQDFAWQCSTASLITTGRLKCSTPVPTTNDLI